MSVSLSKGQKVSLTKDNPGLNNIFIGLGWDVNSYDGPAFDLDVEAFMLDESGKCPSDSDFIFYNNKSDSANSLIYSGDNRTGEGDGDDESITADLSKIPAHIKKIAITLTIFEAVEKAQNFGMIDSAYIRILDNDKNEELVRYDLSEDYFNETSLVVAEIIRKEDNQWDIRAVGSGFESGLAGLCNKFGINVG